MKKSLVLLMLSLCVGCAFAGGSKAVEVARRARIFAWEHSEFESAAKIAKLMKKCNSNAIWFHGVSQYGNYAFYDSKFFPKHPGLERDLLKELSDEFKKHDDLYLFPYQSLGYYIAQGLDPEWRTVGPNGENHYSSWCGFKQVGVCLNNPNYIAAFAGACKEMVINYHVLGMFFDGPRWNWSGSCYCKHCKKFVKDTFGVEPDNATLDKYRAEIIAHGLQYSMREVTNAIKSINKDMPVTFNCDASLPRFWPVMDIADGGFGVADMHRGIFSFSRFMSMLKKNLAFKDKAIWSYAPPGPINDFVTYDSKDAIVFGMIALANGGTPTGYELFAHQYDQTGNESISKVFGMMKEYEDLYFDYKSFKHAAIPFSRFNLDHYGTSWDGISEALHHAQQQYSAIFDENMTLVELKQYKTLLLVGMERMSDKQVEAVKEYVKQGGGLVATYRSSLFDEHGNQRGDFALKDLFKASYKGLKGPVHEHGFGPRIYFEMNKDHTITKGLGKGKRIAYDYMFAPETHHEYAEVKALDGAEIIADTKLVVDDPRWIIPGQGVTMPPYSLKTVSPAIVAGTYGKGRVVYIAPPLEKLYFSRGFATVRKVFANAIEWTSGRELYDVEGPACIVTNLTEKGNKRALHLINYSGDNFESPVRRIEWVAPIYDLKLKIINLDGKKLKKASLLTTGKKIKFKKSGDYATVTIPKIEVYECVMLDYK